ncbi:MAG: hypothetical protein AAFR52_01860 [Pseudomonadota bacterium]
MSRRDRPTTPDGRYAVARGRLRRSTNPDLDDATRRAAVKALMQARLAARRAEDTADAAALAAARAAIDAVKRRLGERGPVWWTDGAPDQDGRAPADSTYATWWASLTEAERAAGMT